VVRELLGADYAGVVGSDRYAGYDHFERRQLCWAHLVRDFQAMSEVEGRAGRNGRQLLEAAEELFRHWHKARDGTIQGWTMRRRLWRLRGRVHRLLRRGVRCGHAPSAGTCAGTCAHLLERFEHLWTFTREAGVEPTNNAAERALRHAVIWRELSFGTQSAAGSRFVERMLTATETCRQQRRCPLEFVTATVAAHFAGHKAPSLLTEP
jgi:transposase